MITNETIELIEKSEKYTNLTCPITLEIILGPCVKLQTHFYSLPDILEALRTQRNIYLEESDFKNEIALRLPTGEEFPDFLLDLMKNRNDRSFEQIENFLVNLSDESQKEYGELLENAALEVNGMLENPPTPAKQPVVNMKTKPPTPVSQPLPPVTPVVQPELPIAPIPEPHASPIMFEPTLPPPRVAATLEPEPEAAILPIPVSTNENTPPKRSFSIKYAGIFLGLLIAPFVLSALIVFTGGLASIAASTGVIGPAAASLLGFGELAAFGIISAGFLAVIGLIGGAAVTIRHLAQKNHKQTTDVIAPESPSTQKKLCSFMRKNPGKNPIISEKAPQTENNSPIENTTKNTDIRPLPVSSSHTLRM